VNLFFYAPAGSHKGDRLLSEIILLVPQNKLEVFGDAHELAERLLKQKNGFSVAILVTPKKEELEKLIPIRDSLRGTRFLLVLSDQERETISLAHRLLPTFISYVENENSEVLSVLLRLIKMGPKILER
jgi:hypothetical protein